MRLTIFFSLFALAHAKKSFEGHIVYNVWPENSQQVDLLNGLEVDYDIWSGYSEATRRFQILVTPEQKNHFLKLSRDNNLNIDVAIEDVQRIIDQQVPGSQNARHNWNSYQNLDSINAFLRDLANTHPDNVELVVGGQSFEGRDILGVKLRFSDADDEELQVVAIEGGIHAREWISPATVTYLINELVTSDDPSVRDIAESFEWHLFPVINPDGYVYSFTDNRLWRKNRNSNHICNGNTTGVDLNRNFNYLWNTIGTSPNPCAENFAGSHGFSEPESRTFSRYLTSIRERMVLYISFHSFQQMLLIPYGHTDAFLDNYANVYEIGVRSMEGLQTLYNTTYIVGTSAAILYATSGTSPDWVRSELGVPLVYLYELRDRGETGFLLPEEQIIPNCEEVLVSLVKLIDSADNLGYVTKPPRSAGSSTTSFNVVALLSAVAVTLSVQ